MNPIYRSLISKALNFDIKSFRFKNQVEAGYKNLQMGVQAFQDLKFDFFKSQGYEVIQLTENQLKVGYDSLRKRLTEITINTGIAASLSTVFSGVWLTLSGTPLLESPAPMIALAVGGGVVVDHALEAYYLKKYAKLSVLSNPVGPAISSEMNRKIQQIIAGTNPMVKLTKSGLEIIGPLGNLNHPSSVRENILSQIISMKKIIVPACVLGKHVDPLVSNITKSWMSCLALPFSFFHLATTLNKSSENRSSADYMFSGFSAYNIYNYFQGESIGEIRKKFSNYLEKGQNPQEILKLILDGHDLQEGMSFLHPWSEDANTLGIRIGVTGRLTIYKNPPKNSLIPLGGAYPIQEFPRENINKENEDERFLYLLGASTIAGIAAVILKSKKKEPVKS